jgi:hypothetical protein
VTGQPPAEWYPDPSGQPFERYWDGRAWSAMTRSPSQGQDPSGQAGSGLPPRPVGSGPAVYGWGSARPALPVRAVPGVTPRGEMALPGPAGREPSETRDPGPGSTVIALATLVPAAVGALAIVAPIAYGLNLLWPIWGVAVPFVVWAAGAVGMSRSQEMILRRAYGYRDPTTEELRRLKEPARRALDRVGVSAGRVRLMIVKSQELNAPATTGRLIVVTSY